MKRKRDGKETATAAPTSSSHDGGSGKAYEVFLNFRGPDTRLTIVDCLYHALIRAGIQTFKDDEDLRVGEEIGGSLLQAINHSRIYITIFSKRYAESKWCLRELAHMMECRRRRFEDEDEKVIFPIFYDVDADDVKLKTELYWKALQEHESHLGKDSVKQWEEALREVGKTMGRNLKDHGLYELINLTVEEVSSKLWTRQSGISDRLVGIKDRIDDIMKELDLGASDVRSIVIHGMGGIGKTSLVQVVFNQISPQFQGHYCFLKDVRSRDILSLQKELLSNVLNLSCINLSNLDEGAEMIKKKFNHKKVLIILDDIDNLNQIMKLVGEPNWFGGGSRIIITTRNIEYLITKVEDGNGPASQYGKFSFYEMPEMDSHDALQLFSERALGCAEPPLDYIDISSKIINALGRLPLALDVVGSTLRGKCPSTWEDVLQKLKKVMNKDVKDKLIISYEALEFHQRQIYLDIACLFINQEKTNAIKYWDAVFEYRTKIEVDTLTRMSMIKITKDDRLWMHDQLRDLGRDIVYLESCNIHLRSRLWSPKDAFHVVQRKMGNKNIVALNLDTPEPNATYRFKPKEFEVLVNLRFLHLDHGNFEGDFKDVFSELRWLSWSNCPLKFRATNIGLVNLVVLELSGKNITEDWGGWHLIMVAKRLRVLELRDCPFLKKMPEFSSISGLERLILKGCTKLTEIGESIGNLQHLDHLQIECEAIKSLPKCFGNLQHLGSLDLECEAIKSLPESIGGLKSLTRLRVQSARLSALPHSICNLSKLKHLILLCSKLQKLPDLIGQLESLLELDVQFSVIRELPHSIGNIERLEILRVMNCELKELPDSIGRLTSLLELDLRGSEIESLPDCIGNLQKLKVVNLDYNRISELPKTIEKLENLEELRVLRCELGEIPSEIGALSSLKILQFSYGHFGRLPTTFNQLTNLQELELYCCDWVESLPGLPNSLMSLEFSLKSMTTIPNLSYLTNLVDLTMKVERGGCPLQEPNIEWLARLRVLRKLVLIVEGLTLPPTDLSSLSQLQNLVITCVDPRSLTGLPSSLRELSLWHVQSPMVSSLFSNLENLSSLFISHSGLREIRFDALAKLMKLYKLHIHDGPLLETMAGLSCLKEIQILVMNNLPRLTEIQDLGELKSLRRLSLSNCQLLESMPNLPSSCELAIHKCPRLKR